MNPDPLLLVVMGDVHAHLALAAEALERIEAEQGRPVVQVFSAGDLGLFVEAVDWRWLTGPKKHRHPEWSAAIARAWDAWRWPLSIIGGNHEPTGPLRAWDAAHFGGKLLYTDAGQLAHALPGLRVYGLSGIHHPDHLGFVSALDAPVRSTPKPRSWPEVVALVEAGQVCRKRLSYYKQEELDRLRVLAPHPHLLLTHDWPAWPEGITAPSARYEPRPEAMLLEALAPGFHLCGHHHRAAAFRVGATEVRALNIITGGQRGDHPGQAINPGWAMLFGWTPPAASKGGGDGRLVELGFWPPLPGSPPS